MSPIVADIGKLLVAGLLGGLIGLDREVKHRPTGLRTNLFICVGAAMFTLLSDQLAVEHTGDHTRIAAQIIPGIGFIGAGTIIHAGRDLVTGITSAATLFVVASVGMAVGGGLYITATLATLLILISLALLGRVERHLQLHSRAIAPCRTSAWPATPLTRGSCSPWRRRPKIMMKSNCFSTNHPPSRPSHP